MWASLDLSDNRPIYVQIMDEIRRALVRGTLQAEDPLPSTREVAAALKVNPRTVMQAYAELEREGVVYMRRGAGTFVAPTGPGHATARPILAREVARRALADASRNGLSLDELVTALRTLEDGSI